MFKIIQNLHENPTDLLLTTGPSPILRASISPSPPSPRAGSAAGVLRWSPGRFAQWPRRTPDRYKTLEFSGKNGHVNRDLKGFIGIYRGYNGY